MRTITAADDALLTAPGGRTAFLRVDVKDSGGTFRDLTTYAPNVNLVDGATWGEDVDQPGIAATIQLKREVEQVSLSPLMQASPLNLGYAVPGTYAPLLDLKREVKIYTYDAPDGVIPDALTTWRLKFHGKVDHINWGGLAGIEVSCVDLQGDIRDAFIERERVYAHASPADPDATKGLYIWEAGRTYAVNELGFPTEANRNAHFYKITAITTGISGATEPVWPTGAGASVVDGGVTWTEVGATTTVTGTAVETVIQQLLNDNMAAPPTLTTPVSPLWLIRWYLQSRTPTWDAIRTLVNQLGWDIRNWFNAGTGGFRLELRQPDRAKVVPDRTFAASEKITVSRLELEIGNIRNVVRVVYSDSQDLDAAAQPKRKSVEVSDATSIARYGRRFCEIAESSASNIDSAAEATTLANAVLADLATPVAEKAVELVDYFYAVELGDLYRFSGDGVYHSGALDLAVVKYEHKFDANGASTTLECRGKPSAGRLRWLSRAAEVNKGDVHRFGANNSSGVTLTASSVVGGTLLKVDAAMSKQALGNGFEFHVSDTPGFTPSSATLVKTGDGNQVIRSDLIPNKTYYSQVIPHGRNASKIVRGSPSAELAFVAGRASSGHINEGIAVGDYPLNGGFETRLDTGGMPDHWTLQLGTYNTDFIVMEDGNGLSGGRYLRVVRNPALTRVRSAVIPLVNDAADGSTRGTTRYRLTAWVKCKATNVGANNLFIVAQGVDYTGAFIGAMGGSGVTFVNAASKVGQWQKVQAIISADGFTSMRGVYVYIYQDTLGVAGTTYDVDDIRIQALGSPWYKIGGGGFTDSYDAVPAFANAWVNYDAVNEVEAAFRRDNTGEVELRGIIKSGVLASPAFTLPAPYRPTRRLRFSAASNNASGQCDIDSAGNVYPQLGSNVWFDMTGIRFVTWY